MIALLVLRPGVDDSQTAFRSLATPSNTSAAVRVDPMNLLLPITIPSGSQGLLRVDLPHRDGEQALCHDVVDGQGVLVSTDTYT